ncbi:lysine transporter LysE [Nocardioides baekrokdamisoli]|uniref:Lysine transporter LysE n=1 Tax=Nocardioides baekrokdamisoli TaxID=1804624 RepID=A0A3G9IFR6_9ACTN|nr:LysE family translocator [Nocardioides baekrokdamisoli]BBH17156.1 lysine transporter LysE [Nocardioides baekrokdamisoli]
MNIELVGAFWLLSLMLVVVPGPDWAYAITCGQRGRRAGIAGVGGLLSGHATTTLVAAAGLAAIIGRVPFLLSALTAVGAGYLILLGYRALASTAAADHTVQAPRSARRQWLTGFGVSALNPKAMLLFVGLLPRFTDTQAAWPESVQILALGAAHVVNCAIIYSLVSAGSQAALTGRPRAARVVSRLSGGVMVALGSFMLLHGAVGA